MVRERVPAPPAMGWVVVSSSLFIVVVVMAGGTIDAALARCVCTMAVSILVKPWLYECVCVCAGVSMRRVEARRLVAEEGRDDEESLCPYYGVSLIYLCVRVCKREERKGYE